MFKLNIGTNQFTTVFCMDGKPEDKFHYEYVICPNERIPENISNTRDFQGIEGVSCVKFQKGPMMSESCNGGFIEDLLAIVQHRLECFQQGPFPSNYNDLALNSVKNALGFLGERTEDRHSRNVEGKLEP